MPKIIQSIFLCCALWAGSVKAETIIINAEDDWAPFSSNHGGVAEGLSVDLIRAAFATQGVEVQFMPVPFARCLYETEHGQVVACFNASMTEENKNKFLWPKNPLLTEGLSILALSTSSQKDLSQRDLEGHIVGITNGYTYPTSFMNNKRIIKDISRTDAVQLKKILAKRIEYGVVNTTPASLMINAGVATRGKIKIVGTVELSLLYLNFSKNHKDGARLLDIFEKGLKTIRANGSYARIQHDFNVKYGLLPPPAK